MKKKPVQSREGVLDDSSVLMEEEDIFADLVEKRGTELFLGKYTMAAIQAVLEKKSFIKDAKKIKYIMYPVRIAAFLIVVLSIVFSLILGKGLF